MRFVEELGAANVGIGRNLRGETHQLRAPQEALGWDPFGRIVDPPLSGTDKQAVHGHTRS